MFCGLKHALSMRTSTVLALISVFWPPMTPASAIGPAESAMSRSRGDSLRSTPSSVFRVSPSAARLLRPAVEKDPAAPDLPFNLGWALLLEGDAEASAFWMRGVVKRDPRDNHLPHHQADQGTPRPQPQREAQARDHRHGNQGRHAADQAGGRHLARAGCARRFFACRDDRS